MTGLAELSLRVQGSLIIISLLLGTGLAWYALGAVRWEAFVKRTDSRPGRLLRLILAILIGGGLAGFVLQYAAGTAMLRA